MLKKLYLPTDLSLIIRQSLFEALRKVRSQRMPLPLARSLSRLKMTSEALPVMWFSGTKPQ